MRAIVLFDATCKGPRGPFGVDLPGLTAAWRVGSAVYRATGRFDVAIGASRWAQALEVICAGAAPGTLGELQLWCHGKWGQAFLADDVLDASALKGGSPLESALDRLRDTLCGPRALVWFRTCETFGGVKGQRFAEALAARLSCRVAGHTHIIGPLQSGLHALAPGERAGWSVAEGIVDGAAESPRRAAWSSPLAPRTISCLRSHLPPWAHDAAPSP